MSKVIIFQEDEKALNYEYQLPKDSNFKNLSIKVLSYNEDKDDFIKSSKVILNNHDFDNNTVFLLHPTKKNTYIEESIFEDYIFKEKIHTYIEMAQKLGAKKVILTAKHTDTKRLEKDINGSVTYKVVNIDGTYKKQVEDRIQKTYLNEKTFFKDDKFNLEQAYLNALNWINEQNLHHDQELTDLIKSCDPKKNNTLATQTIKTTLTKESNQILEIAANLGIGLFSLKGGFSERIKELNEFSLEIVVEF